MPFEQVHFDQNDVQIYKEDQESELNDYLQNKSTGQTLTAILTRRMVTSVAGGYAEHNTNCCTVRVCSGLNLTSLLLLTDMSDDD